MRATRLRSIYPNAQMDPTVAVRDSPAKAVGPVRNLYLRRWRNRLFFGLIAVLVILNLAASPPPAVERLLMPARYLWRELVPDSVRGMLEVVAAFLIVGIGWAVIVAVVLWETAAPPPTPTGTYGDARRVMQRITLRGDAAVGVRL